MSSVLKYFNLEVPRPPVPQFYFQTDTGTSGNDRITSFDNSTPAKALKFLIMGTTSAATIRLYMDGVLIGSGPGVDGASALIATDGVTDIADGVHNFTAIEFLGDGESIPSPPVAVTIDTIPPVATIVPIDPDPRSTSVSTIT